MTKTMLLDLTRIASSDKIGLTCLVGPRLIKEMVVKQHFSQLV
jgi:hypothetical protein